MKVTDEMRLYVQALEIADWMLKNNGDIAPDFVLDRYAKEIAIMEEFAGEDGLVDTALIGIHEAQARRAARLAIPQKRREIASDYDALFLKIGRRDGFACNICGSSTSKLQIDHVVALINGGSNDLSNLQLLCPPCNMTKSDH